MQFGLQSGKEDRVRLPATTVFPSGWIATAFAAELVPPSLESRLVTTIPGMGPDAPKVISSGVGSTTCSVSGADAEAEPESPETSSGYESSGTVDATRRTRVPRLLLISSGSAVTPSGIPETVIEIGSAKSCRVTVTLAARLDPAPMLIGAGVTTSENPGSVTLSFRAALVEPGPLGATTVTAVSSAARPAAEGGRRKV